MKIKTATLFLSILCVQIVQAQSPAIDSLKKVLSRHPEEDTVRVSLLNKIAFHSIDYDPNKAIAFVDEAISLAKKLRSLSQEANALNTKACAFINQHESQKAIDILKPALAIDEQVHDENQRAQVLYNLGIACRQLSNIAKAKEYIFKAKALFKQQGNRLEEANALNSLGGIFDASGNYQLALSYFDSSLTIRKQINDLDGEATAISNIGLVYANLGDFTKAITEYQISLSIAERTNNKSMTLYVYTSLGFMYGKINDYKQSLTYFEKSIHLASELNNMTLFTQDNMDVGLIHFKNKDFRQAMQYYERAWEMVLKTENKILKADLLNNIGSLYFALPDTMYNNIKNEHANKQITQNRSDQFIEIGNTGVSTQTEKQELGFKYYQQALSLYTEGNINAGIAHSLCDIGYFFQNATPEQIRIHNIHGNKYDHAIAFVDSGLHIARSINSPEETMYALSSLYDVYELKKDFGKALDYYKQYIALRDSTMNSEKAKEITRKEIQYDFDKKEAVYKLNQTIAESKIKNTIYLSLLGIILLGSSFGFIIYRNRIKQLNKMIAVRNTIASNLHDEIGSTLSSISIMSEVAQMQSNNNNVSAGELLKKISTNSQEIVENMKDIVWSINPEHDQFEDVVIKMRQFAAAITEPKGIDLIFDTDTKEDAAVNTVHRHDLYLIFKEALNNAVKYAGATRIKVHISIVNKKLELLVQDNGKGFDEANITPGNGLINMRRRAAKMNASLQVVSQPGEGTKITLTV